MDVLLHATNMQNNSNLSEDIGALFFFFFCRTLDSLGMPDHTQRILHDIIKVSMDIWLYGKNEHYTSVFEILKFKKSCNLIGGKHFVWLMSWEHDFFQTCSFLKIIEPIMGHHLKQNNVALNKMPNILLLIQICLVYLII